MIARIALLHTAAANAALFDAALEALPVRAAELSHHARPDLLRAPDAATLAEAARMLEALARGADAVILTCSAIGAAAGQARAAAPVLRADAALAEAAMRSGQPVTALYANPDSEGPTTAVFTEAATRHGAATGTDGLSAVQRCGRAPGVMGPKSRTQALSLPGLRPNLQRPDRHSPGAFAQARTMDALRRSLD